MSEPSSRLEAFQEDLKNAIAEGRIGRQLLIEKVKAMPIEEIARLPATATAMLGADGLAKIAQSRIEKDTELTDMRVKPQTTIETEAEPLPSAYRRPHPLTRAGLAAIAILALGLGVDVLRPFAARWLDTGVRPISARTWPACLRLDRHVDGCLYTTGFAGLTLRQAATMLGMPATALVAVNRHLDPNPDNPLPAKTKIIVWRGTMTLEGLHK